MRDKARVLLHFQRNTRALLYIYSLKAVIVSFGNFSFSQFKSKRQTTPRANTASSIYARMEEKESGNVKGNRGDDGMKKLKSDRKSFKHVKTLHL